VIKNLAGSALVASSGGEADSHRSRPSGGPPLHENHKAIEGIPSIARALFYVRNKDQNLIREPTSTVLKSSKSDACTPLSSKL
jgi:hypothetical protein